MAWLEQASRPGTLIWKTQQWIPLTGTAKKRPDLLLYHQSADTIEPSALGVARSPRETAIMIVECKISALFTDDQLLNYDRWLAENGNGFGALVLLTHLTEAPDKFVSDDGPYQTPTRTVVRWSQLKTWLAADVDLTRPARGLANLRGELLEFLIEEGLMTDEPDLQDLAAARIYLVSGAHLRVAEFIKSVRSSVRNNLPQSKNWSWPNEPPKLWSEPDAAYGAIVDWCDLPSRTRVGWGLSLGDGFWPPMEPPMPWTDGGCIWIECGQNKVERPPGDKFKTWHFPTAPGGDGQFYIGKTIGFEHLDEPTAKFSAWLIEALGEAQGIVDTVLNTGKHAT